MRVLEIFVIIVHLVVFARSRESLCDEIEKLRKSRFFLCQKKFGTMELPKCKYIQIPSGNTLKKRIESHFLNRISSSFIYFEEVAKLCYNHGPQLKNTGRAIFQDRSAENPTASPKSGASIINSCNGYKGDDIWKCLNGIDDRKHYYHAAHLIATSILPMEKTKIDQSDEEFKKLFCKVSIMSGYTERLPAFINQGVDKIFDKWQVESIKKVLDNCKDYYTNGKNTFKRYLVDLQQILNKYSARAGVTQRVKTRATQKRRRNSRTRVTRVKIRDKTCVKKAVIDLAKESVAGYNESKGNTFRYKYTTTVDSFLEASKRRKD